MDRTTKILLFAIALGLWANAALQIVPSAHAYGKTLCGAFNKLDCLASIDVGSRASTDG
jgi:hypothetical protein